MSRDFSSACARDVFFKAANMPMIELHTGLSGV